MWHLFACVLTIAVTFDSAEGQQGRVELSLQMIEFNSYGKDDNGESCDPSIFGSGVKRCDPKFLFCLDKNSGSSSMSSCDYFRGGWTQHWTDSDTIHFGGDMKGVDNPIRATVTDYRGMRFKMEAEDEEDVGSDDNIDLFDWPDNTRPDRSRAVALTRQINLSGERRRDPARLYFVVSVYCVENSYGPWCDVYCEPLDVDGQGHYGCDPDTGDIYCLEGWEGLNVSCLVPVDNCAASSCANGGLCVDEYNRFSCQCLPGFTGPICAENIDDCVSNPCMNNGTCIDGVAEYVCQCSDLYTGPRCERHRCHEQTYCHNVGTCYEAVDNNGTIRVACLCPPQFTGQHCDVDTCEILQCVHGQCVNGTCVCEPNFVGGLCDVTVCDVTPCHNGGNCTDNGICVCGQGFTGRFCESKISPCSSYPCLNGGICITQLDNSYECRCQTGFNGTRCGNVIETPIQHDEQTLNSIEDKPLKSSGGLPGWAVGLVIAIALLCLILALVFLALMKFRRKYKQSQAEITQTASAASAGREGFENPVYSNTEGATSTVAYNRTAETTTIHTGAVGASKKMPAGSEEEFGMDSADSSHPPPPYTQHPPHIHSLPLPSYEDHSHIYSESIPVEYSLADESALNGDVADDNYAYASVVKLPVVETQSQAHVMTDTNGDPLYDVPRPCGQAPVGPAHNGLSSCDPNPCALTPGYVNQACDEHRDQ